jgi:hypothetical protein
VLRNGANDGFWVPEAIQPGTPGALGWKRMQKDRERRQMGFRSRASKMEIPGYTDCYCFILQAVYTSFVPYRLCLAVSEELGPPCQTSACFLAYSPVLQQWLLWLDVAVRPPPQGVLP